MIVTIDGPSGVGKSAVAEELARVLRWTWCSVGQMYRALAYAQLRDRSLSDISTTRNQQHLRWLLLGNDVTDELYSDSEVLKRSLLLASDSEVQQQLNRLLRSKLYGLNCIVEGRTAHALFPEAKLCVFLNASKNERRQRSRSTNQVHSSETTAAWRDELERKRSSEALHVTSRHMAWDSTHATLSETVEALASHVADRTGTAPLSSSIIVPARNRASIMKRSLPRLRAAASSTNSKLIVVNDGSTDGTAAVAAKYADEVVDTPGIGAAGARNLGLGCVESDVVLFVDSDMSVSERFVAEHIQRHRHANDLVVIGSRSKAVNADPKAAVRRDSREVILDRVSYNASALRRPWSIAYGCNLSVSRSLLKRATSKGQQAFLETMTGWGLEDVEFACRLHNTGARWSFLRQSHAVHLHHEEFPAEAHFKSWTANLAIGSERTPELSAMTALQNAFSPHIQEDFMQAYEAFDGYVFGKTASFITSSSDSIEAVSTLADRIAADEEIIVVQQDESQTPDVALQFAGGGRTVRVFSESDWNRVGSLIESQYAYIDDTESRVGGAA